MKVINNPTYIVGEGYLEKTFHDEIEALAYEALLEDLYYLDWFFSSVMVKGDVKLKNNQFILVTSRYIEADWLGHHPAHTEYSDHVLKDYISANIKHINFTIEKLLESRLEWSVKCPFLNDFNDKLFKFKSDIEKVKKIIDSLKEPELDFTIFD